MENLSTQEHHSGRKILSLNKSGSALKKTAVAIENVSTRPASQRRVNLDSVKKNHQPTFTQSPPNPLIETWVWMWQSGSNPDIKTMGKQKLIDAFGSIQGAVSFIEKRVKESEKT